MSVQVVLFVGVTILLASTYVTLSGPDRVVQQESLVKLAQPIIHEDPNPVLAVAVTVISGAVEKLKDGNGDLDLFILSSAAMNWMLSFCTVYCYP